MAAEWSHRNLYLFGATLIVNVNNLIRDLINLFLNELEIVKRLEDCYRTQGVWRGLLEHCYVPILCTHLLFVNLEHTNHQSFRLIFYLRPKSQNIGMLKVILLVPPNSLNNKDVALLLKDPVWNFEHNAVSRYCFSEFDLIMVEVKVVLNFVYLPKPVGLAPRFQVWTSWKCDFSRENLVHHTNPDLYVFQLTVDLLLESFELKLYNLEKDALCNFIVSLIRKIFS